MIILRLLLVALCAAALAGCGGKNVAGLYRDESNPAVCYELRADGTWSAELSVGVPAGVFPHGAGKQFEGNFTRSGQVLELVCTSVRRQDPISGDWQKDATDPASCTHRLLFEEGVLVPIGPRGEKEALFATDLNPFGARKLVSEGAKP